MDNHEESGRNAAILLDPLSVKPKTNSFGDERLIDGAVICVCICVLGIAVFLFTESFLISIVFPALLFCDIWVQIKQDQQTAYIDAYQFPAAAKERVGKHYPHLSDEQLLLVMQGLRQYFKLFSMVGNEAISMPSRVVDVAWHEFILFTQAYRDFCQHGIGQFIHHTPAEEMISAAKFEEGMKKAWFLSCKLEKIDQKSPSRLPFLFAIDAELDIPDGFNHSLDNDYATDNSTGCGGGGCGGCGGG